MAFAGCATIRRGGPFPSVMHQPAGGALASTCKEANQCPLLISPLKSTSPHSQAPAACGSTLTHPTPHLWLLLQPLPKRADVTGQVQAAPHCASSSQALDPQAVACMTMAAAHICPCSCCCMSYAAVDAIATCAWPTAHGASPGPSGVGPAMCCRPGTALAFWGMVPVGGVVICTWLVSQQGAQPAAPIV
eukprot:1143328-Pelagomonas_calceolata.AAC.13